VHAANGGSPTPLCVATVSGGVKLILPLRTAGPAWMRWTEGVVWPSLDITLVWATVAKDCGEDVLERGRHSKPRRVRKGACRPEAAINCHGWTWRCAGSHGLGRHQG